MWVSFAKETYKQSGFFCVRTTALLLAALLLSAVLLTALLPLRLLLVLLALHALLEVLCFARTACLLGEVVVVSRAGVLHVCVRY